MSVPVYVLYVSERLPSVCVCVCVHFVTDVASCMFALREEVRNITALLQTACFLALLRTASCLYDLSLGDKVTSSIIFSAGPSVSYRLL